MKLTIVTGYGPDMEEVAAITVPRMKVLADRLGATMVVSSKTPADCPDRPVPWLKIKDLAEALESYEGALWIDADIVLCRDITAEDVERWFLSRGTDLVMGHDFSDGAVEAQRRDFGIDVQAGVIFLRSSAWSRQFLADVWNQTDMISHAWEAARNEQGAIAKLLGQNPEHRDHATIDATAPYNVWRAKWQTGDPTSHFAGTRGRDLVNGIKSFVSSLATVPADLSRETAAPAVNAFVNEQVDKYPFPAERFTGKGVVICSGGLGYNSSAYVTIRRLRELGCSLPIQVWYLGEMEYDAVWAETVKKYGVDFVDARKLRDARGPYDWLFAHRRLNGWEMKAYAIMHSPFREVLLLDADNMPLQNPEALFETPEYKDAGTILWPDLGRLPPGHRAWSSTGVAYRDEPEVESGQIVTDKSRSWKALVLTHWMHNHSAYFYGIWHGDKETFHLAWRRTDTPYAMPLHPADAGYVGHGQLQQDFTGQPLFYHCHPHHCAPPPNIHTPEQWRLANEGQQARIPIELAGTYEYVRFSMERRPMHLAADGEVSAGRASRETRWQAAGNLLSVYGDDGHTTATYTRMSKDGPWVGRWIGFERNATALLPAVAEPSLLDDEPWKDPDDQRIDRRHALMLYGAAMLLPAGSTIVELGTHRGASALYLEAAARAGLRAAFVRHRYP